MPTHVACSSETVPQLRLYARQLHTLIAQFKDLIDSYVVEFFVKKRWDVFPKSWQAVLDGLQPHEIASVLLDKEMPQQPRVWPLSLLAYRAATRALSLDPTPAAGFSPSIKMDPTFKPIDLLCRLHVKEKKRHEILRMAEVINTASSLAGAEKVVDVGSGQGHLSRLVSFGYGLKVTSIEAVGCHLTGAAKVDKKIKTILKKRIERESNKVLDAIPHTPPQHVECTVHPQITVEEFLHVINDQSGNCADQDRSINESRQGSAHSAEVQRTEKNSSTKSDVKTSSRDHSVVDQPWTRHVDIHERKEPCHSCQANEHEAIGSDTVKSVERSPDSFVLAGLHTCGDLAPTMLRVFSKCAQARALTSVACCYMRMKCALPKAPLAPSAGDQELKQDGTARKRSLSASLQNSATLQNSHAGKENLVGFGQCEENQDSLNCQDDADRTLNLRGYPMSKFVHSIGGDGIKFEAMELACHSLESYRRRLKAKDPNLILHGYRSTLEVVIQEFDREMTQSHDGICRIKKAVANVRKPHLKTFQEYASSALANLNIPYDDRHLAELEARYRPEWSNVITFHVLRSMMAPVIESLLLVDRVLYLYEQGIDSKLVPVFDAALSPRNFVLVAVKDS